MATIPTEITEEISRFEQAVDDFLNERISDSKFQRIRLQHGVYGQRQDGVQMIRIKIPFGGLNAEQFERIADVCEKYSKGVAHITTRQDFQVHFVKIETVPALMRDLAEVGVTTREACGNTVRNVTASPYAGVDPTELFDVTPYAKAFAYHMLRNPICQNMGRKFKVAFEGGTQDHARVWVHDLGFVARIKDGKRGFQFLVGGGLGPTPFVGKEFYDFMSPEEMIPMAESILRIFDRYGERKIRSKARMKFLIKKWGFDKFKELVLEERKVLEVGPHWNDFLQTVEQPFETNSHPAVGEKAPETDQYLEWKQHNANPQKQDGYSIVEVRCLLGDMVPSQMRQLAALSRKFSNGNLRVSIEQNMHLRWIHNEDLPALYQELKKINLHHAHAQTIYDVTACPGTDTCRLGISASRPMAKVLEERLQAENGTISKLAEDLHIKISGCPNSCAQHHIGQIGFHGAALPQKGHTVPAFQLHLGGGVTPEGTTIGQIVTKIPSKYVPEATVRLIRHYADNGKEGESFNAFYERVGRDGVRELLHDLEQVKSYEEDPDFYVDWGDKDEFALQHGVVGECAGSPVSDVEPLLGDVNPFLEQARALFSHGEFEAARNKAYEAIAKAADAMLYKRMVQTFNQQESVQEFDNHFVRTGEFAGLNCFRHDIEALHDSSDLESSAKELVDRADGLMKMCQDYNAKKTEAATA